MPETETIRAFIAIPTDQAAIAALLDFQEQLKKTTGTLLRWSKPGQLHITLKFLGDVEAAKSGELEAALREACAPTAPLHLRLGGLTAFPRIEKPNVVCVDLAGDLETLNALQARIETLTKPLSAHHEDRQFHPHITLARVKDFKLARKVGERLATVRPDFKNEWTAATVELIRSELLPQGPRYTNLATVELRGAV